MHLIKKSWKKVIRWVTVIIERIIVNCNVSQHYSFYDICNKISDTLKTCKTNITDIKYLIGNVFYIEFIAGL